MSKKRKTRREKRVSDKRHFAYHLETSLANDDSPKATTESTQNIVTELPSTSYKASSSVVSSLSYVRDDIRKITIITAFIITMQIALYFLMLRV